ncbi:hypothetical protein K438DRAFT_861991 [Mycena galopus ATCC 62051]|nr:hypothetical protein K438DRAFT_861991 [Mycena galopus ATCC 62051]
MITLAAGNRSILKHHRTRPPLIQLARPRALVIRSPSCHPHPPQLADSVDIFSALLVSIHPTRCSGALDGARYAATTATTTRCAITAYHTSPLVPWAQAERRPNPPLATSQAQRHAMKIIPRHRGRDRGSIRPSSAHLLSFPNTRLHACTTSGSELPHPHRLLPSTAPHPRAERSHQTARLHPRPHPHFPPLSLTPPHTRTRRARTRTTLAAASSGVPYALRFTSPYPTSYSCLGPSPWLWTLPVESV